MKILAWVLVIALVVVSVAWNYASNSSRYEHAKYLQTAYQGGVKYYSINRTLGVLEFDSPSMARLRSVTPYKYSAVLTYDEAVPVSEGELQQLTEKRAEYGPENVAVMVFTRRDLSMFDPPWSSYLELSEFELLCENEQGAYKTAKCFSESRGGDEEQLNSGNKLKALQWMNKAYYEASFWEEKDRILDEYMVLVAARVETFELAAAENNSLAAAKFRDAPIMSTETAKLLAKKVEEKWPKDACKQNSFYWLFVRDPPATTVLRARCSDQLARKGYSKTVN